MAKWVGRQRVARAQGGLSEERLQVLYAMGFEFGEVAQLTDEWEAKFDQLIEWVTWQVCGLDYSYSRIHLLYFMCAEACCYNLLCSELQCHTQ